MTIVLKQGVTLQGLQPVMRIVLREADEIWKTHNQQLTITSCCDGCHSAVSWHYYGYALDFRTNFWEADEARDVYLDLKQQIPDFDVVHHDTHIHCEIGNSLAEKLGVLF